MEEMANFIRFSASGLRYDDERLEPANGLPGDPISFDNSTLRWVFFAQSFSWLTAFAVFLGEAMWPLFGFECVSA